MLERLKQKSTIYLLTAIVLELGTRYGLQIDTGLFHSVVDVVSFILFGFYVYHTEDKSLL